jgi:hypothetical protein
VGTRGAAASGTGAGTASLWCMCQQELAGEGPAGQEGGGRGGITDTAAAAGVGTAGVWVMQENMQGTEVRSLWEQLLA